MFTTLSFDTEERQLQPAIESSNLSTQRKKNRRHQVSKACANCRAYRIRCDSEKPCRNCTLKGRQCRDEDGAEVRTFASAMREIDRLNQKIQEMKEQLETGHSGKPNSRDDTKCPSLPVNLDPLGEHGGNRNYWECVQVNTVRSGTSQCYGPASLFYFIARMSLHLDTYSSADPGTTTRQLSKVSNTDFETSFMTMSGPINRVYMDRSNEEIYLRIFWDTYHSLLPIMEDDDSFWAYYSSLWTTSSKFRQSSALIDIMLAICLQHGTNFTSPGEKPDTLVDGTDEMIASRWFYRRSQQALTNQLETPSIITLQTHILSVAYLSNANTQNAAHSTLAIAIRASTILGLHLEPSENLAGERREFLRRLWWTLYAVEMKFAMDLGRPLAINLSQVTCTLPSNGIVDNAVRGHSLWLNQEPPRSSFGVHYIKLVLATRAIYITFHNRCAAILGRNKQESLYQDTQTLETCAEYLTSRMQHFQSWVSDIPDVLKLKKKDSSASFSTHAAVLDLGPSSSPWLQRQRLFLELQYHNMALNLFRPFICFPPPAAAMTTRTDELAESCAKHAMATINIIHQVIEKTDIWMGHHDFFRWQWNASISLLGYMLAYPTSPLLNKAREVVHTATHVFEKLGNVFAMAIPAGKAVQELLAKVTTIRQGIMSTHHLSSDEYSWSLSQPSHGNELLPEMTPKLASVMGCSLDPKHDFRVNSKGGSEGSSEFLGLPLDFDDSGGFLSWPKSIIGEDEDLFRMLDVVQGEKEDIMLDET